MASGRGVGAVIAVHVPAQQVQGRQGQVSGEGYLQGGVQVAIQTRVECVGIIHHLVKAQVYPRKIR